MSDMESLRMGEVAAVSPYWTPEHIDVTDTPIPYAAPKPSWLDALDSYRPIARIDSRDRELRRAMSSHTRTTAVEIRELPPLPTPAFEDSAFPQTFPALRPSFVQSVKGLLRRRSHAAG